MAILEYIKRVFNSGPNLSDSGSYENGGLLSSTSGQTTSSESDELLGRWHSEDDGSGLHFIWGSSLELNDDGTGIFSSWGDTDPDNSGDFPVSWIPSGKHQIKIRFSAYSDWETIHYRINKHTGPYDTAQLKLTDDRDRSESFHKEGFWIIGGGLFKEKTERERG
jgi:hypothetical protein